jgi:L-rhamnose mutarotase
MVHKLDRQRVARRDDTVHSRYHQAEIARKKWRSPMKRVGFLLKVKEDKIEEYKYHHDNVWPEMQEALARTGWNNYSLFMKEDGMLFGYFEAEESFQASLEGMSREEVNAKWQEFMAPFFEGIGGAHADESMIELEEVFHVN